MNRLGSTRNSDLVSGIGRSLATVALASPASTGDYTIDRLRKGGGTASEHPRRVVIVREDHDGEFPIPLVRLSSFLFVSNRHRSVL